MWVFLFITVFSLVLASAFAEQVRRSWLGWTGFILVSLFFTPAIGLLAICLTEQRQCD